MATPIKSFRPKAGLEKVMAPPRACSYDEVKTARVSDTFKRNKKAVPLKVNTRYDDIARVEGKENFSPYHSFNRNRKVEVKPARLGTHTIYKQTTKDVQEYMREMLPDSFRLTTVDDMKRGADWVLLRSQELAERCVWNPELEDQLPEIHAAIFKSLNSSIRLRQHQAQKYVYADRGHQHLIAALLYVREVLQHSKRTVDAARRIKRLRRCTQ